MKASDAVALTWVAFTITSWVAAGLAAADGSTAGAFAYSVAPFAFAPGVGLVMGDLDARRARRESTATPDKRQET